MSILLSVGSDYEVFIREIDSGKIVSAIPIISGTKDKHLRLDTCSIHHDNVVGEVNIIPADTGAAFVDIVTASLAELGEFLGKTGHTYVVKDNHVMEEAELHHLDACEFGCESDYDVITGKENEVASAHIAGNLRTAGGHIHIGYTFKSATEYRAVARLLSMVLSLGTTIMGDTTTRRKLYGKFASVRMKKYGVEVRSPSNIWLTDPAWIRWVYNACYQSIRHAASVHTKKFMGSGKTLIKDHNIISIRKAVETCDKDSARRILRRMFGFVPPPNSKGELAENIYMRTYGVMPCSPEYSDKEDAAKYGNYYVGTAPSAAPPKVSLEEPIKFFVDEPDSQQTGAVS